MDGDDAPVLQSRAELEANLAEYTDQLAQVDALLASDPANAEYADVREGLTEVISLTRDLLADAAAADGAGAAGAAAAAPPPARKRRSRWDADAPREVEEAAAAAPPVAAAAPTPADAADAAPARPGGTAPAARHAVSAAPIVLGDLPKWLKPAPGDDARTRERKAKAAKAFKSKARFARLDAETARKAASWQAFKGGVTKKRPGLARPVATVKKA